VARTNWSFDGASFALDARRATAGCACRSSSKRWASSILTPEPALRRHGEELSLEAEAYQALVLGVRDYIGKSGFKGAIIGLSGGIDSALTLCVAVDALGAEKVRAVMMPSPYTAQMSLDDSRAMIKTAGRALRRNRHFAGNGDLRRRCSTRCLPGCRPIRRKRTFRREFAATS
jgi:hypothetical protein